MGEGWGKLPGMATTTNKLTGAGDALRALDAALDAIGLNKRDDKDRKPLPHHPSPLCGCVACEGAAEQETHVKAWDKFTR